MTAAIVTTHFIERVNQRVGDMDPHELAHALDWAITNNRTDLVEYAGRIRRDGTRAWRFRSPSGRRFLAIACTDRERIRWITVLAEGQTAIGPNRREITA